MVTKIRSFLFKGWLIEALFLTGLAVLVTLSTTFATDSLYKVRIGKKVFETAKLTIVDANGKTKQSGGTSQNSTNNASSTSNSSANTSPGSTSNSSGQTGTSTPPPSSPGSNPPSSPPPPVTPPPTVPPPPAVPPPPPPNPPPAPSGCFVTVNGYLYNMQSAVGKTLRDPNTGKTRTHSSSTFQCGSFASPTNMTSIYLSRHSPMGCAARLTPYIYSPPAPTDPTC